MIIMPLPSARKEVGSILRSYKAPSVDNNFPIYDSYLQHKVILDIPLKFEGASNPAFSSSKCFVLNQMRHSASKVSTSAKNEKYT